MGASCARIPNSMLRRRRKMGSAPDTKHSPTLPKREPSEPLVHNAYVNLMSQYHPAGRVD